MLSKRGVLQRRNHQQNQTTFIRDNILLYSYRHLTYGITFAFLMRSNAIFQVSGVRISSVYPTLCEASMLIWRSKSNIVMIKYYLTLAHWSHKPMTYSMPQLTWNPGWEMSLSTLPFLRLCFCSSSSHSFRCAPIYAPGCGEFSSGPVPFRPK